MICIIVLTVTKLLFASSLRNIHVQIYINYFQELGNIYSVLSAIFHIKKISFLSVMFSEKVRFTLVYLPADLAARRSW